MSTYFQWVFYTDCLFESRRYTRKKSYVHQRKKLKLLNKTNKQKGEKKKKSLLYSSIRLLSRKLNKKPLTMRRAMGLGIQRHRRPSTYATMPDSTNLPIPHLQMNITFCSSSRLFAFDGTIAFWLSSFESFLQLMLATNLLACFLSIRIAKLTNRCSNSVSRVGPSFHSCW